MRLTLAIGAAFAALSVTAAAQQTDRVFIRHGGPTANIDANDDGWITRAEASAGFDRAFDDMDSNDDGSLDSADRRNLETFELRLDGPGVHVFEGEGGDRRIIVRRAGDDANEEEIEREIERAERDIRRDGSRDVVIIRRGDGTAPAAPVPPTPPSAATAPVPPLPPAPPMFMMLIANSDEADLDGDGALSRDEFRNQHLRFFDASDANGDGRVRFEPPPAPPEPPQPPEAPTPPTPPRHR